MCESNSKDCDDIYNKIDENAKKVTSNNNAKTEITKKSLIQLCGIRDSIVESWKKTKSDRDEGRLDSVEDDIYYSKTKEFMAECENEIAFLKNCLEHVNWLRDCAKEKRCDEALAYADKEILRINEMIEDVKFYMTC